MNGIPGDPQACGQPAPGCAYCIEGFTPAFDTFHGPHFTTCPRCTSPCPYCVGRGRFPLTDCLDCYTTQLVATEQRAWLCPECLGVLEVT